MNSNPLKNWQVDRRAIQWVGSDLQRPECILAERNGTLWTADARGGVVRINPDGSQKLIAPTAEVESPPNGSSLRDRLVHGTLPNGIAFDLSGNILIANFGTDTLDIMTRDGHSKRLYDTLDGVPLGKVNFVLQDSKNRFWITVSTRTNPWTEALRNNLSDGYICLLDDLGLRIVADGFSFTNEIRLDANEEYIYVAETTAKRVSRLRVRPDGSLGDREIYGPSNLGPGVVDGIAFDSYGNLWCTMIFAERLVAITPDGDLLTLLDDGNAEATARFEREFATGSPVPFTTLEKAQGTVAPWMASVTFGGPDLKTVYLGHLRGSRLPTFKSPVAGLPMAHWYQR